VSINSRIVVDTEQFRKSNSSYSRLFTQKSSFSIDIYFGLGSRIEQADSERVESRGVALDDLNKDDLLVYTPTVLAFSLEDKF
jgi:hypothetical protein